MKLETALTNRRILITRDKNAADSMIKEVLAYGGEPLVAPVLAFEKVMMSQEQLSTLANYDWVIFTSGNGVRFFLEQLDTPLRAQLPKIAVVGKKTAMTLHAFHLKEAYMPASFTSKALAESFLKIPDGQKILIVKGQLAKETLENELMDQGHHVETLTVYQTLPNYQIKPVLDELLASSKIDIVTFTSPSSLDFFLKLSGLEVSDVFFRNVKIACIGPETRHHAKDRGFASIIMPEMYTAKALIKAIADYYMGGTPCIH